MTGPDVQGVGEVSRYADHHGLDGLPANRLTTVTFAWNDVAIVTMLSALREHYPSGYASMRDHVRNAIAATQEAPEGGEGDG